MMLNSAYPVPQLIGDLSSLEHLWVSFTFREMKKRWISIDIFDVSQDPSSSTTQISWSSSPAHDVT
jgi:hypothetical protein